MTMPSSATTPAERRTRAMALPPLRDPDATAIHAFIEAIPACRAKLEEYSQDGNKNLLAAVDEHLDRAAAGLY